MKRGGLGGHVHEYVLFKTMLPVIEITGDDAAWDPGEFEVEVSLRSVRGEWYARVRITDEAQDHEDDGAVPARDVFRTPATVGASAWSAKRLMLLGGDTATPFYSQNASDGYVVLDITKLAVPVQIALDAAQEGRWADLDKLPEQLAGLSRTSLMSKLRTPR